MRRGLTSNSPIRPPLLAPPVDDATREAFDRVAPPRVPKSYAPVRVKPTVEELRARINEMETSSAAAPAERPREAPDPGKVLLRLARTDGTELRVSLHHYQGAPFVRVGPWQSGAPDAWPLKGKGATVKVRELTSVASALLDAAAEVASNDGARGSGR